MGWLLASVYDRWLAETEAACLRAWREELLGAAEGDVLEVGAGTGANLDLYPRSATLTLSEPDRHMRARLARRARGSTAASIATIDGAATEALPYPDQRFDVVVSTLVLCSVTDLQASLRQIRRVLRPGGKLLFIEHVKAPAGTRRRLAQQLVEPAWRRLAGNCHLTRVTDRAIEEAGLTLTRVERESMRKALPIVRPTIRGVATR
ncbi:MAG: class I SAM-dependent methyltransferase [Polyangiaceae bacterium]